MPQLGVSVSEDTITKWLKQPGETVVLDEGLLEISTDKVDTEVPSPGEGIVAEIIVQEGQTVEVGTVLAVIMRAGSADSKPGSKAVTPTTSTAAPAEAPAAPAAATPESQVVPAPAAPPSGTGRTFVSPVVARIASQHEVDPRAIRGTGAAGRVTKTLRAYPWVNAEIRGERVVIRP